MEIATDLETRGEGNWASGELRASARAWVWLSLAYPVAIVGSFLLKPSIRIPSVIFPPFALELAAMLMVPVRRWPWVAVFAMSCDFVIMSFVSRAVEGHFPEFWYSAVLSSVTTFVAMGTAVALQVGRVFCPGLRLKVLAHPMLLWILPLGALPGALVSSWLHTVAVHQPLPTLETIIRCLSATLSVVALCPLIVGLLRGFDEPIRPLAGAWERLGIGATFAALSVFFVVVPWQLDRFLELMLLAGPLLWVSLRGAYRDVAWACAAIAVGIGVACSHGLGHFPPLVVLGTWRDGILSVQVFLLIVCTEALLINRFVLDQRALLQDSMRKQARLAAYGKALDDAEESTRREAARDLHDGVAQIIAGQSMLLDVLRKRLQELPLRDLLDQAIAAGREAQLAVRTTIQDLSPPELDRAGPGDILTWLADHFRQRYQFTVNRRTAGEPHFERRHARLVYRAVRELIFNAYKHAEVQAVNVDIASDETGTVVSVSDGGVGFDPANPAADGRWRHGLNHLAERVAAVQGHLDIRSSRGRGCRVTLYLPTQPSSVDGFEKATPPSRRGDARGPDRRVYRSVTGQSLSIGSPATSVPPDPPASSVPAPRP